MSSDANQRESYRRHSKTQSGSESDDRTPSPLETSKGESDSLPASSVRKKTKLNAGIEVEVEEMEPTERRKIAAAKRSTQESMLSAKERFLARKRARLEMEAEKPAEDD